jgi:hypothetical protein
MRVAVPLLAVVCGLLIKKPGGAPYIATRRTITPGWLVCIITGTLVLFVTFFGILIIRTVSGPLITAVGDGVGMGVAVGCGVGVGACVG